MAGAVPAARGARRVKAAMPFIGAWSIWLAGYTALLIVDYALRASGASGEGVGADPLWVALPLTVAAGAAAGYFMAAGAAWRWPTRLALLLVQVPLAWLAAVSLGFTYLCLFAGGCP